jgi:glycine cleavage system H protein
MLYALFCSPAAAWLIRESEELKMTWNVPADARFTESDEWIRVEGDEAWIGITDYAQDKLSDIVFVELPEVGRTFAKSDVFGVVESVKASSDLNMPAGGEVIAVNHGLEDTPETVNEDPYGEGWIIRIKLSDPSDLDSLYDPAAYTQYSEERG